MDQKIADEIMRLLGYDPDYIRDLIANDVALGIKQAEEMNENMCRYGTIDAPKTICEIQEIGCGLRKAPNVQVYDYAEEATKSKEPALISLTIGELEQILEFAKTNVRDQYDHVTIDMNCSQSGIGPAYHVRCNGIDAIITDIDSW